MIFPDTIPAIDICKTNPEYHPEKIALHNATYNGGTAFDSQMDKILFKRESEEKNEKIYRMRKRRSKYINRVSGLLNLFRASVFRVPPFVTAEPESEYWTELNYNADGNGTSLPTVARDALLSMVLHNRAYFLADFREREGQAAVDGSLDARLQLLDASMVDDWSHDEFGALVWVRLHTVTQTRTQDYLPPDKDVHRYIYISDSDIVTYELCVDIGSPPESSSKPAMKVDASQHAFGRLPVFEIRAGEGQWMMEKLYPIVVQLFNRESAHTWQLDRQAFAQLVLTLEGDERVDGIFSGETEAIILRPGESAGYTTPPESPSNSQLKDIERLTKSLYEVVNSLALTTQTQNARQSAKAKELDRNPLEVLLRSFAHPILTALRAWVEAVKEYRGESNTEVSIAGMDVFMATMDDVKESIGLEVDDGRETGNQNGSEAEEADESGIKKASGGSYETD